MGINNGIGRVWAANAGDEGRPAGVGPVWIENIDALIPSGSGGSTYTGGNGIEVDNTNNTISLDDEAQAAIDSYVTNSGSFITSADVPEVPTIKDFIAGNGINITTTSADVTIAAKVDGSTIKIDGSGNLSTDITGVPTTSGASNGDVLTYNGSSVGWAAPQGGGGGSLPPIADNTVRCRFTSGYTPTMGADGNVCVDVANNIWDITDNTSWDNKFNGNQNLLEVLGGHISTVQSRDLTSMFSECASLRRVSGMSIDVVDPMSYTPFTTASMFYNCYLLGYVEFIKCDIVSDASSMFDGCMSLRSVDGLDLSGCSNVSRLFSRCEKLLYGYDGSLITARDLSYMYAGCYSLIQTRTSIMSLEYLHTSSLDGMFQDCHSLMIIPWIDIGNTGSDLTCDSMFSGCWNAISGIKEAYNVLSGIGPTSYVACFDSCGIFSYSGKQDRLQIPASWGGDGA
jgi:hypothetical protein